MGDEQSLSWWRRLWSRLSGNGKDEDALSTAVSPNLPVFVPEVKIERNRDDGLQASLSSTGQDGAVDAVALRQQMMNHLDMTTLVQVATAVDVDVENIVGGKGRKVMGLVQACGANGRLPQLLNACQARRPDVEWQPDWGA